MPSTTTPAISSIAAPDAYLQSGSSPPTKADLQQGWETYRKNTEPHGLAFGKLVYDFRASAEVVRGGTTFESTLRELSIPKTTAYFWMNRYAELIGVRQPAPLEPDTLPGVVPAPVGIVTVADIPVEDANNPPLLQTAAPVVITDAINFPDTEHISQPYSPNPNFNKAGTRGYAGKDAFNSFIRSLVAIAERNPNSPFVSKVDTAFSECDSDEMAEVAVHELTRAINRLSEYQAQFAERKIS